MWKIWDKVKDRRWGFCCSVAKLCMTLQSHGLQHTMLPCPSPTPGAYSNSCPLSRWCHPTISSFVVPFSSRLQYFPASGSSSESALRIRWPKYGSFSFSISYSNEYSGLILVWSPTGQKTLKISPTPWFKSINSSALRVLYNPTLTSISSVQLLSHVWLFATPRTAACQASLFITNSQNLFKLMSIESVMPSNYLSHPYSHP